MELTKRTIDSIREDLLAKEVEKSISKLKPAILKQVEEFFRSKEFEKELKNMIHDEILGELSENNMRDIIGDKKMNEMLAKAVKSQLK